MFVVCFDSLPCGLSDDTCLARIAGADANQDPLVQRCFRKYADCMVTGTPIGSTDDICAVEPLLANAARAGVDACMSGACSDVGSCVDAALGPR